MIPIDSLYKDVIIFAPDGNQTDDGECLIFSNLAEAHGELKYKDYNLHTDYRAIHGAITSARYIPMGIDFDNVFILIDSRLTQDAVLFDVVSQTEESLAAEIETVMGDEELVGFDFDIDDVYIVYGYELVIGLTLNDEDIDDLSVNSFKEMARRAKELGNGDKDEQKIS